MQFLVLVFLLFAPVKETPLIATEAICTYSSMVSGAVMWWCKSCGLAYPAKQKVCLNKNCSLFRKPQK